MAKVNPLKATGQWWLPHEPDLKTFGTLTFDSRAGGQLELSLTIDQTLPYLHWALRTSKVPLIHGTSSNAISYSLFDCSPFGPALVAPGVPAIVTFYIDFALHGLLIPHIDTECISRVTTGFKYLNGWIAKHGITLTHPDGVHNIDIKYRRPEPREIAVGPGLSLVFESLPSWNHPDWQGAVTLRERGTVFIEPATPKSVRFFLNMLSLLSDFFTLATLRLVEPENVEFEEGAQPMNEDANSAKHPSKPRLRGKLHSRNHFGEEPKGFRPPAPPEYLFCESDIENPGNIFSMWIQLADATKNSRNLYNSAIYGSMPLETRFLTLTQAVESFHRRLRPGSYMSEAEYNTSVRSTLERCIPETLDDSFKAALRSRIRYGREFSLRKRLNDLVRENHEALRRLLGDISTAVDEIVDTRNHLTHYSHDDPTFEVNHQHLINLSTVLRVILEYSLLAEIGFSREQILVLASRGNASARFFLS